MKKRKFIPLLSIAILPLTLAASCSTSWVKWKENNGEKIKIEFENNNDISQNPKEYSVRKWNDIIKKNIVTFTKDDDKKIIKINIDLKEINNPYELIDILKKSLGFNIQNALKKPLNRPFELSDMWNYFTDENANNDKILLKFISSIYGKIDIEFKYGNIKKIVTWDIQKAKENFKNTEKQINEFSKKGMIKSYLNDLKVFHSKLTSDNKTVLSSELKTKWVKEKNDIYSIKKFDVQFLGISSDGAPRDFGGVASKGSDFIAMPIVSSLLEKDSSFAMRSSKLVNLPSKAMDGIKDIFSAIVKLVNDMYSYDSNNDLFKKWLDKDTVDFSIKHNGFRNKSYNGNDLKNMNMLKLRFLERALKENDFGKDEDNTKAVEEK